VADLLAGLAAFSRSDQKGSPPGRASGPALWDTGTGATVAQEPEPGREVGHRCWSRCGTDVPELHTITRFLPARSMHKPAEASGELRRHSRTLGDRDANTSESSRDA